MALGTCTDFHKLELFCKFYQSRSYTNTQILNLPKRNSKKSLLWYRMIRTIRVRFRVLLCLFLVLAVPHVRKPRSRELLLLPVILPRQLVVLNHPDRDKERGRRDPRAHEEERPEALLIGRDGDVPSRGVQICARVDRHWVFGNGIYDGFGNVVCTQIRTERVVAAKKGSATSYYPSVRPDTYIIEPPTAKEIVPPSICTNPFKG
jgi:hypothetical protein